MACETVLGLAFVIFLSLSNNCDSDSCCQNLTTACHHHHGSLEKKRAEDNNNGLATLLYPFIALENPQLSFTVMVIDDFVCRSRRASYVASAQHVR